MFEDEGDGSSDEDLSKRALPIGDESKDPIDLNKIPTTGEEYLRQVRFQASQLPDFRTATELKKNSAPLKVSGKKHPWHRYFNSETTKPNDSHRVSIVWQNEKAKFFSEVRDKFFSTRDALRKSRPKPDKVRLKSAEDYWKWCFAAEFPFDSILPSLEEIQIREDFHQFLPTLSRISCFSQFQLHELLQNEIVWLKKSSNSSYLMSYIFATLVAFEKPIDEDAIFSMRQLCASIKKIRAAFLKSNDEETNTQIKSCDLFVCLVGRYFGQLDLADPGDETS